jgi:excisionase family DNA binding protein
MPEWLTTAEAATRLGVHPSRVTYLVRAGRLAARKWGRDWQIEEAAVERIAQQERRPGRPATHKNDA